jgi:putative membrane protein
MRVVIDVLITFVALQHLGFLVLESVLWTKPQGRKVFNTTQEQAAETAVLAKNQGAYNGFLAFGLIWSLFTSTGSGQFQFQTVFLGFVIAAAVVGGATVSRRILLVQGLPATIAMVLVLVHASH